jgi:hypothetical protein
MFTIEPFVGPLPLRFGMSPEEVASLLGAPGLVFRNGNKDRCEKRPGYVLGYDVDSGKLNETVHTSGELFFQGTNLFAVDDLIGFLRQFDPAPQAAVGSVVFMNLGLYLSGFDVGDADVRSIAVTVKGRFDQYLKYFVPFKSP